MSDHVSTPLMEGFSASTLDIPRMVEIGEHLASCEECLQLFHEVMQKRRNYAPVVIDLSPESWLRWEHFEYEQLVQYVDERLDETEREMADIHLKTCEQCREDVRSFRLHRERMETELSIRYAPIEKASWRKRILPFGNRPRTNWNPVYPVAAAVIIAVAAVLTVILSQRNKTPEQQAQQAPATNINNAAPGPAINTTQPPQSTPSINETAHSDAGNEHSGDEISDSTRSRDRRSPALPNSRITKSTTQPKDEVVSLNDGGRKVVLDKSGEVIGIGTLPPYTEQSIKEALLAQHLKRPDELADVIGESSALRGTTKEGSFKLLSPQRAVIADDRPTFAWEPLRGATGYQVHVADSSNHSVVTSEELSSRATRWTSPVTFKRGAVYTWVVTAKVDGEEVISPGVEAPEMKFKVMDEKGAGELNRLKKSSNSHLALGVFYARAGMVAEAEREFQTLVEENPQSDVARKLLRSVRSWR